MKLLSIAEASRNTASDNIWLLQTDPSYMRHYYVAILREDESVPGWDPLERNRAERFGVIAREIAHDAHTLWTWDWIMTEILNVQKSYDRCADRVKRGQALPSAVNHSLSALETLLVFLMNMLSKHLQIVIPSRPGFRDFYTFEWRNIGGTFRCLSAHKDGTSAGGGIDLFLKDPLQWCIQQLLVNPNNEIGYDHGLLFGFLEQHLASGSEKERSRLDQIIYQKLSDYATLHEMIVMVRLHRPRCTNLGLDIFKITEPRKPWKFMQKNFLDESSNWFVSEGSGLAAIGHALRVFESSNPPEATNKQDKAWLDNYGEMHRTNRGF